MQRLAVTNQKQFDELVEKLATSQMVCIDLETTGVDQRFCSLVGLSLCLLEEPKIGYYIPLAHLFVEEQLPLRMVLDTLKPHLERIPSIAHNAKFEIVIMRRYGIELKIQDDTLLMAYCVGEYERFGLKHLVPTLLRYEMTELKDLFGGKDKNIHFENLPLDLAVPYAADDVIWTLQLWKFLQGKVVEKIYKIEMRLMYATIELECNGWKLDFEFAEKESARVKKIELILKRYYYKQLAIALANAPLPTDDKKSNELLKKSFEMEAAYPFNSPKKTNDLLYNKLALPVVRTTKTGNASSDGESLTVLAALSPIAANLSVLRSINRFAPNYYDKYPRMCVGQRIYTNYIQSQITSGRYASNNPNLQNVSNNKVWEFHLVDGLPIDEELFTELGVDRPENGIVKISSEPRKMFIAEDGYYLFGWDFSQVELRWMAGAARDRNLLSMYEQGIDVHRRSASNFFLKDEAEITWLERWAAKRINFMLIYGGGYKRLYSQLEGRFTLQECERLHRAFFQTFPAVKSFHRQMQIETDRTWRVTSYFGRRQIIPEYFEHHANQKTYTPKHLAALMSEARRAGPSRFVQGSCADILKITMVRMFERRGEKFKDVKMVGTLHDALYFEVPNHIDKGEFAQWCADLATHKFEGFPVIRIECSWGHNWAEMDEVGFVDPYPIVARAETKQQVKKQPKTLRFDASHMTSSGMAQLKSLLENNQGDNLIILIVQGQELPLVDFRTSLDESSVVLSNLLGKATEGEEIAVEELADIIS